MFASTQFGGHGAEIGVDFAPEQTKSGICRIPGDGSQGLVGEVFLCGGELHGAAGANYWELQ